MTEELTCIPADIEVALASGGSAHLSYFRGQKVVVHFCPAGASAELAAFDALREDFAHAGAWLVTASPDDRAAFYALAGQFDTVAKHMVDDHTKSSTMFKDILAKENISTKPADKLGAEKTDDDGGEVHALEC